MDTELQFAHHDIRSIRSLSCVTRLVVYQPVERWLLTKQWFKCRLKAFYLFVFTHYYTLKPNENINTIKWIMDLRLFKCNRCSSTLIGLFYDISTYVGLFYQYEIKNYLPNHFRRVKTSYLVAILMF